MRLLATRRPCSPFRELDCWPQHEKLINETIACGNKIITACYAFTLDETSSKTHGGFIVQVRGEKEGGLGELHQLLPQRFGCPMEASASFYQATASVRLQDPSTTSRCMHMIPCDDRTSKHVQTKSTMVQRREIQTKGHSTEQIRNRSECYSVEWSMCRSRRADQSGMKCATCPSYNRLSV